MKSIVVGFIIVLSVTAYDTLAAPTINIVLTPEYTSHSGVLLGDFPATSSSQYWIEITPGGPGESFSPDGTYSMAHSVGDLWEVDGETGERHSVASMSGDASSGCSFYQTASGFGCGMSANASIGGSLGSTGWAFGSTCIYACGTICIEPSAEFAEGSLATLIISTNQTGDSLNSLLLIDSGVISGRETRIPITVGNEVTLNFEGRLNTGVGLPGFVSQYGAFTADFSVIPEPGTMALLALGGLAFLRRRRKL